MLSLTHREKPEDRDESGLEYGSLPLSHEITWSRSLSLLPPVSERTVMVPRVPPLASSIGAEKQSLGLGPSDLCIPKLST